MLMVRGAMHLWCVKDAGWTGTVGEFGTILVAHQTAFEFGSWSASLIHAPNDVTPLLC